jgi:hypothetical protein
VGLSVVKVSQRPSRRAKKAWARILTRAGVKDVRTLGSWMAAEGHSLSMIGRALNHTQPSTTAIYARLELGPLRTALEGVGTKMLKA